VASPFDSPRRFCKGERPLIGLVNFVRKNTSTLFIVQRHWYPVNRNNLKYVRFFENIVYRHNCHGRPVLVATWQASPRGRGRDASLALVRKCKCLAAKNVRVPRPTSLPSAIDRPEAVQRNSGYRFATKQQRSLASCAKVGIPCPRNPVIQQFPLPQQIFVRQPQ